MDRGEWVESVNLKVDGVHWYTESKPSSQPGTWQSGQKKERQNPSRIHDVSPPLCTLAGRSRTL